MSICRLCKKAEHESIEPMAKYEVRHYAHFSCGLARWGASFLEMIPVHVIGAIPYRLVDEYHLHTHPRLIKYRLEARSA